MASSDSSGSNSLIPRHKDCALAFGLQTCQGATGTPTVLFPLDTAVDGIGPNFNRVFFQYSDGASGLRHYRSEGVYSEGSIDIPLMPTWVDGDMGEWMFGRDEDNYFDGWYATLYKKIGNLYEQYLDVRVTKGTIERRAGAAIRARLDLVGLSAPTAGSTADFSGLTSPYEPYTFDQASLEMAPGGTDYGTPGDSLAADVSTLDHTLEFDNMAIDPKEMLTVGSGLNPSGLPFADKAHWKVSFDRYFTDTQIYEDFLAAGEAAYQLTLTHPAATCVFLMPRVLCEAYPLNIPDSGFVKPSGISFQALAAVDDSVDACTVEETPA